MADVKRRFVIAKRLTFSNFSLFIKKLSLIFKKRVVLLFTSLFIAVKQRVEQLRIDEEDDDDDDDDEGEDFKEQRRRRRRRLLLLLSFIVVVVVAATVESCTGIIDFTKFSPSIVIIEQLFTNNLQTREIKI